jgi:hypothetical protein
MLLSQMLVQGTNIGRSRPTQVDLHGLVGTPRDRFDAKPVVADFGEVIGKLGLVVPSVGLLGTADVLTDGALGNTEGLGNLDVGLFLEP